MSKQEFLKYLIKKSSVDKQWYKNIEFHAAAKLYDIPIILISVLGTLEFAAYTSEGNK